MSRFISTAVLAFALLGAGPASKPATKPGGQPTEPPTPAAQEAAATGAEKDLARAKAEATAAFDASEAGRALIADVETKKEALAQARAGGVKQARLDATKAYGAARAALQKARAAAASDDRAVSAASGKAADTKAALDSTRRKEAQAAEAERMKDPMNQAAAKGSILIGMTREQVREAMGVKDLTVHGVESTDGDDGRVETWRFNGDRPNEAVFHNGVLVKLHNRN